jgi:hypothetical protein
MSDAHNWLSVALLTSQQGSSVVITHPGLDYALEPASTVICHGDWTPPEGRTFTGRTHAAALALAVAAFTEATR